MYPVHEVPEDIYAICKHWCWPPVEGNAYDPSVPCKRPQFALVGHREACTAGMEIDLHALQAEFVGLREQQIYRESMPGYYADFCRGANWCRETLRLSGARKIANFDTTLSSDTILALREVDVCIANGVSRAREILVGRGLSGSLH